MQRPLEPVGVEVRERVVEQHRQRPVAGAEQPDELEPLHQVGLLLGADREPVEVDDRAGLGRLDADAQVLVDERVGVAAAGQPRRCRPRARRSGAGAKSR